MTAATRCDGARSLEAVCVERLEDLVDKKLRVLLRRVERIATGVIMDWNDRPALSVVLTL